MKTARTSPRASRWIMRIGLVLLAFAISGVGIADAKRRRRKKRRAPVNEKALAELRGPYRFGMSPKQVLGVLRRQIHEKYAEKISATSDVYTQDRLRRKRDAEVQKIRKSYVKFDGGRRTGWEGSIIQDQFRHKTDESMLMFWETDPSSGLDQRRFFFFHDGELYKMFVALNSDTLKDEQRNFSFLKRIMEARFGPGEVTTVQGRDGEKKPHSLHWQTGKYQAWAIDNMRVFGAFCLVIADAPRVKEVAAARERLPKKSDRVKLIDNVIEDQEDDEGPSLEESRKNVVDELIR